MFPESLLLSKIPRTPTDVFEENITKLKDILYCFLKEAGALEEKNGLEDGARSENIILEVMD